MQLEILPADSPLQAELFIPARAIGFVEVGQDVRLLFDAFPYQRFGTYHGKIVKVSQTVLLDSDVSGPVKLQEPAYAATVALVSRLGAPLVQTFVPNQSAFVPVQEVLALASVTSVPPLLSEARV